MLYKDAIKLSMEELSKQEKTIFIGYNTRCSKGNGTLACVPDPQLIETPVAENLMLSMGIGMSLRGYKPIVYFERFDFILNAMDSLVNHLDKMNVLSKGEFNPKVLIRVVVGASENPLFTCCTHTQNFSEALSKMINIPVIELNNSKEILKYYHLASSWTSSMILVEKRDLYNRE